MQREGKKKNNGQKLIGGGYKNTRVLHVLSSLEDGGGIQSIIRNYYLSIVEKGYVFDFIVHGDEIGGMEEWFENGGSRIFHIPPRSMNFIGNIAAINRIIKSEKYEIIHCHQDYHSMLALMIAKHYSIRKRIVHSHQAYPTENCVKKIIRVLESSMIKHLATNFIAVSEDAGNWLYGKSYMKRGKVSVIYNCIKTDKFKFNPSVREKIRQQFSLNKEIVVGHVGRFTEQKNHSLLLKIFSRYHSLNIDTKLMLAGDGILMDEIKNEAKEFGIYGSVLFLGARTDVNELYQAMDVLILPSRFEGFGNVVIEAQAAALPVVCSPFVPHEVKETDLVSFIPNDDYENIERWVEYIDVASKRQRIGDFEAVIAKKHGVDTMVNELCEIYKS